MFHTKYKCEDKFCDVIVDGGSTKNFGSKEMVTKLKLKREKHPQIYHISWVQDDHKVLASEKCLLKLNIWS